MGTWWKGMARGRCERMHCRRSKSLCQKYAGDLSCVMHSTAPGDTENLEGQGHTKVALMTRARGLYLIWYELESHQMLEDLVIMPEAEPVSHTQKVV